MGNRTIEFFWDAVSPYTYLAATQIEALAAKHGALVIWKPMLLGKVFEASGNRPPISVKAKVNYLFRDVTLWAKHYGVPLRIPSVFPAASITAMRIACGLPAEISSRWGLAVMNAYWGEGKDIGQAELLKQIASSLDLDPDTTLALAQDPAIKDQLKTSTEDAVRREVFGAPAFFIDNTLFWGNDRLPLMDAYLAGRLGP